MSSLLWQSFARADLMRQILVTGGAGFIGSHTVDLLLANDKKVIVLDNLASGNLDYLDLSHPHLEFINGNILDYALVKRIVADCDAVMHLAALPSVPKSIEEPVKSLQVNMQGFIHILQAIRESGKSIRLVYASSAAVYGDSLKLPCDDDAPLAAALSPYALEKANNERYADLYARLFNIKSLGLRYFNVYGPRQDPTSPYSGVISKFIELYQQNKVIQIFGDGRQSRDFIHVSDIAKANLLALTAHYSGVLNIATGIPETLQNLVQYIEALGKKPASLEFAPGRAGDVAQSYAKIEKAKEHLGFCYATNLEQGIQSLLEIMYH
jgi:UDP-glucose 4-epimerase